MNGCFSTSLCLELQPLRPPQPYLIYAQPRSSRSLLLQVKRRKKRICCIWAKAHWSIVSWILLFFFFPGNHVLTFDTTNQMMLVDGDPERLSCSRLLFQLKMAVEYALDMRGSAAAAGLARERVRKALATILRHKTKSTDPLLLQVRS